MKLTFHIEAPAPGALGSRFLKLRGWCFVPGATLRGVRLLVDGSPFTGHYGAKRPDIRAAFPDDVPDAFSGFEVRARLSGGKIGANLEFQNSAGEWLLAERLEFTTPRWARPLWMPGTPAADLVAFQLGACATHRPKPLRHDSDSFPSVRLVAGSPSTFCLVTPSFNQGHFLQQTAASVLDQTSVRVIYHVQDGGSTDGTVAHLKDLESRGLTWQSQPDKGQADAIARGFAPFPGQPTDIMAWINSDDFYLPGALAYVADYFKCHPEVDIVYGHRILVDEQSREIGRWFLPPHDDEVLRLNDFVPQETMFWRRRIWEKVGGIDTSFKFAMDWDLLLRFQAAGAKIVRVPYFLACFRIHSAQKTSAQMESVGQKEIDALRLRTFGRVLPPAEIENHPRLLRYLRKSAWIEFLWRSLRIRHP